MTDENTVFAGEETLLKQWRDQDQAALRTLAARCEKLLFPFMLCLTGCDKDSAYDLVTSALVQSLRSFPADSRTPFLVHCIREAIEKARRVPAVPAFEMTDHVELSRERKLSLKIVKQALFSLAFESRILLLLRDQMNLPYDGISEITGVSMKEARFQTVKARLQLRAAIEEILRTKGQLL
jgi:DNA-directed RNA polymerase specialized sigma24 family protein